MRLPVQPMCSEGWGKRLDAEIEVHYGGVGCEMNDILEIGNRHGPPVVEGNAHGLFRKYRGEYLANLGCLATQSFHEAKNLISGGGPLEFEEQE